MIKTGNLIVAVFSAVAGLVFTKWTSLNTRTWDDIVASVIFSFIFCFLWISIMEPVVGKFLKRFGPK
jgi:multidrug transporter EmrE-like cation transporter